MDRAAHFTGVTVSIRHPLPLVADALTRALHRLAKVRITHDTGDILLAPLSVLQDMEHDGARRLVVLCDRADRRTLMEARALDAISLVPLDLPMDQLENALERALSDAGYWPTLHEPVALSPVSKRLGSLSGQQFKVLDLMSRGRLNKQIAYDLGISEGTVKSHVSSVLRKLGVERRTQAIAAFITTQDMMGGLTAPRGAAHAAR